nr:probable protein phosphatase 2C 80 [Ipomoea batatas]
MPSALLSSLNSSFTFGVQKAVSAKQIGRYKLAQALPIRSNYLGSCRGKSFAIGVLQHSSAILGDSTSRFSGYSTYLCKPRIMAASGSTAAPGDFVLGGLISSSGNVSSFANPASIHFGDRSCRNCWKTSMSVKHREVKTAPIVHGYFIFDITGRSSNSSLVTRRGLKSYSTSSSSPPYSEGSSHDEHLSSLAIPVETKTLDNRSLMLVSGSCYLPHPAKVETGGEDAHFICADEQAVGVADGVGGWADVGINAGEYARELMYYSMDAILHEPKDSIDPARVLEKAHSKTKAKGSSTACIIALNSQGLHAINLGDSGFIIVRDGCTIFESPVQQHGFNFTYQLESGSRADLPSSGQVFTIAVSSGDVIVAGTDGLFDNLYKDEVAGVVRDAVNSGCNPEATAQKIAALARQRALDRKRQTPFADAAQEAGYQYYGGKLDDLTVVVSFVT